MTTNRGLALRRIAAFGIDWLAIALWAGGLFLGTVLVAGDEPRQTTGPWTTQAIGFFTLTLPVVLYCSAFESSRWRATPGKRCLGLAVAGEGGDALPFVRALARNAIKFAPWEAGHVVATQMALAETPTVWAWVAMPIAFLGPLWWLASIATSGVAPYDRVANARVRRASTRAPAAP